MTYRKAELSFGSILLFIGLALLAHTFDESYSLMSQELSLGPMFFPRILLILWVACCLAILVGALGKDKPLDAFLWGRVFCAFGIVCLFVMMLASVGFIVAGFIYFILMAWFIGFRKIGILCGVALFYTLFMQFLFSNVLEFVLPSFPNFLGWGG